MVCHGDYSLNYLMRVEQAWDGIACLDRHNPPHVLVCMRSDSLWPNPQ